jgi:hypothetical protein
MQHVNEYLAHSKEVARRSYRDTDPMKTMVVGKMLDIMCGDAAASEIDGM